MGGLAEEGWDLRGKQAQGRIGGSMGFWGASLGPQGNGRGG